MTYFKAYIFHIRKRTPLGRNLLINPMSALFFILKGNIVDERDKGFVNSLYKKYVRWLKTKK